jgi:hypothetical protein
MSSTIIKINPSDIIADSMDKINYNFEVLSENENQVDYKLSKLSQTFNEKLETITTTTTNKHIELNNYIETLENKIDSVSTMEDVDIQGMVTDAIQHADSLLEDVISRVAGEQVDAALGDYAKTSELDALRETVNTSIAADTYFADASKKMASASRIVANSKFYTEHNDVLDKDCWVYNSNNGGDVSTISNLEEFYDSLNPSKQAEIKGDSTEENPLDDPEVVARLVAEAEKTFKQISTELSAIMQSVSGGKAVTQIIAAVREPNQNGKEIAAGIFLQANQSGSDITLNADRINLTSDHKLTLTSGTFTVDSTNFKVDASGNVEMSGKITATSGTIGGITISNNSLSSSNGNFSLTSDGILTVKGANIGGRSSFSGGFLTEYEILGRTDNPNSGHILKRTRTESSIKYYEWILEPDGCPYISVSPGGLRDYVELFIDYNKFSEFTGKRFIIMAAPAMISNPNKFILNGNYQGPSGEEPYIANNKVCLIHPSIERGVQDSNYPTQIIGDGGSYCIIEFVSSDSSGRLFGFITSQAHCTAIMKDGTYINLDNCS